MLRCCDASCEFGVIYKTQTYLLTNLLTYLRGVLQLESKLHEAFKRLACVAVFLEEAIFGERESVNENTSFETELRLLEDDDETGLYWLLCALR